MNVTGLKIGLCALLALTSLAANASVNWNFKTASNYDYRVSSSTGGYQFTGGDLATVTTLSAWSAPVSGSKVISNIDDLLAHNQYGLVIDQDGYGADGSGYGNSGSDSHTIDNSDSYEFVMFDFGAKEFSLEAFDIGWNRNDPYSDVTVMAYQGGTPSSQPAGNVAGVSLGGLSANGWSAISHYKDVGTGSTSASNLNSVYSSYWIIGAYMSAVGTGTGDSITDNNWDGIKLAGITGTTRSTPPPPGNVPEPGTLLLTALGLAFIARKKIATKN